MRGLLLLVLVACGAAYPPCPSGVEIEPGGPSCAVADTRIAEAVELLELTGAWHGAGFGRVVVFARDEWAAFGGTEIAGQTETSGATVYLGLSMRGGAHELLHRQEDLRGGAGLPSNYDHAGWSGNGRWALSNLFAYAATNNLYLDGGDVCAVPALLPAWRDALLAAEWHTLDWGQALRNWDAENTAASAGCVR